MKEALSQITVLEEGPDLEQYQSIPISFEVRSKFEVCEVPGSERFDLVETPVAPYIKDYDALEKPSDWPARFDTQHWGFFTAFEGERRLGRATIAWKTAELNMLEGRLDLACLWDIRVSPEYRGHGIGKLLFKTAADWARARVCTELTIETQNINVPACRFYESVGCIFHRAIHNAYPAELNEIQLIWRFEL